MKKDNMRVIAVAMGEPDSNTRNNEISGMLDYAFSQFSIDTLQHKGDIVDNIKLDNSDMENVDIITLEDVNVLYKKVDGKKNIKTSIKYNKIPVKIKKGDVVGKLIVSENNNIIKEVDLTVNKNVNKASFWDVLSRNFKNIIIGNIFIKNNKS